MEFKKLCPLLILPALLLAACASDVRSLLSEDGPRAQAIEVLVGDASTRNEVIDRLLSTPNERTALLEKIVENEKAAGALVEQMMASDRGKAVAASRIVSDRETLRDFFSMMMVTGAAGELMSQGQAECLGLGDQFAHGNQTRTMVDLQRLGKLVDDWARENGGVYPVCDRFEFVTDCLASSLPNGALADLRVNDAWGRPFVYNTDDSGTTYVLISYATDGEYDGLGRVGPTSSYNADIVFSDGEFVQWPGHIRKESLR